MVMVAAVTVAAVLGEMLLGTQGWGRRILDSRLPVSVGGSMPLSYGTKINGSILIWPETRISRENGEVVRFGKCIIY